MTISVFLLDDHEIVRRGIAQLLESEDDIEVVGEAGTAAQAMARIPALRPDVAILDVRLPDGDGVTVCRDIRSAVTPPPACLMLTSYSDDEALFGAIMAGAAGYLLKQVTGVDLVGAVRTVAAGGSLLDPRATAAGPAAAAPGRRPHRSALRVAEPAGTPHPRADRRRADQPADRRRDVPGREDGQELRLLAAAQARLRPAHRGRGVRRRAAPRSNLRRLSPPGSIAALTGLSREGRATPAVSRRPARAARTSLAAALDRPLLQVAQPAAGLVRVDARPRRRARRSPAPPRPRRSG